MQKTAYEMRISDWSSDVCSSDLSSSAELAAMSASWSFFCCARSAASRLVAAMRRRFMPAPVPAGINRPTITFSLRRSEEHTSELQSLMRISYAVFCLKKKNKNNTPADMTQAHHEYALQHIIYSTTILIHK